MKTAAAILTIFILTALAGPLYSQSLADLARKEKERRESVKEAPKVITNSDKDRFQGGAVTTVSLPAPDPKEASPAGKAGEAAASEGEKAKTDEPVDFQGRTESFWRQSFADARQKVAQLELEANVLTLKIADLQNRFYMEDDGFKQQTIQREIQKAFYEQDLNKKNLEKAREELLDLEKEARKSGALPGWMKPGNP